MPLDGKKFRKKYKRGTVLILKRLSFLETGVFGELLSDSSIHFCFTLEHAYADYSTNPPTYVSKIPNGVYTCKRGMHILEGMSAPFETFEITGIPGHTNILFHVGNVNADSAGCVLLGTLQAEGSEILNSRLAFTQFMDSLKYLDSFDLTVI